MTEALVIYHNATEESGTYWAECPQLPGWSASADNLIDLMELVRESLVGKFGPNTQWRSCWENGAKVIAFRRTT